MANPVLGRQIPYRESIEARTESQPARGRSGNGQVADAPRPTASSDGQEGDKPVETIEQFEVRRPMYRLVDVLLPPATQREFESMLSRIRNHDVIYQEWGLARIDPLGGHKIVNFYGLPGTGKTMLAEALAHHLGKPLLEVSYAEIESKYVGQTPKNIRAAFRTASREDAVLFFDEADSILGRRLTDVTASSDHAVNVSRAVMLKELDVFTGIVVFATNLARNFDGAFVRRILLHIEIPAPDEEGRRKLLDRMLPPGIPGRDDLDLAALAKESDGLVGGEIKNVVLIACAAAANRAGALRRVMMDDLIAAIASVNKAKRNIGRYDYDDPLVRTTVVERNVQDLPPDVRAKYDAAVGVANHSST